MNMNLGNNKEIAMIMIQKISNAIYLVCVYNITRSVAYDPLNFKRLISCVLEVSAH